MELSASSALPSQSSSVLCASQISVAAGEIAGLLSSQSLLSAQLEAERLRSASLEALLKAERQRAEALELVARAERERAEVERLRGGDWRDRATALQAELEALRSEQGLPWWRRLIG